VRGKRGHGAASGEGITLHLEHRDRADRKAAVGVKDRILAVLPGLVGKAGRFAPGIVEKSVAIGIAGAVDPRHGGLQRRPERPDELQVACAVGIGTRQDDEQRRGVDAAVILPEGQFVARRHLALAGLVHDLAGSGIAEGGNLLRLMLGEERQHAPRQAGIEPQGLQRGDDGIAAEGRGEPGDPGVGVRPGIQIGGQQRQIGTRLVDPLVEDPA
jgi:hypothetical protein